MYSVIKINSKFSTQSNVIFTLNHVINIELLLLIPVLKKCEVFCVANKYITMKRFEYLPCIKDSFPKSVFNHHLLIIGNTMLDVSKRIKLCRCSFKKILFWLDKCFEFITYSQCACTYAQLVLDICNIITQDKQPYRVLMVLLFCSYSINILKQRIIDKNETDVR